MSRGFPGGQQVIKSSDIINCGELFILKTILANYTGGTDQICLLFGWSSNHRWPHSKQYVYDVKLVGTRTLHFAS